MDEKAQDLLDRLAISTETVFGYAYAGLLTTAMIAIVHPAWARDRIEDLGTVLSLVSIITVGSGVFVICHRVLGPLVLYRTTHWIHERFREGSTKGYLRGRRVNPRYLDAAYDSLKERFLPRYVGTISHAHGEIQFLYVTAVAALIGSILLAADDRSDWWTCLLVSLGAFLVAMITDIKQHELETVFLQAHEKEVDAFLAENGFRDPHSTT